MNVMQRPLFRQAGGPVAPQMAGAQDPRQMVRQVEAQTAQEAAPMGAALAQQTMSELDTAESPEQLINAMRGNARPLEERYAELAGLVGQADAERTPESVLALVQPTMMMTEQGALDSGIGELLQNLTGNVAMETPDGAPTAMGQGVGSLMMAGAPQGEMGVGQPPVANFSQGGAVQRFQAGGEASRLGQIYSEMLPVYQGILGDPEESRRMGQAQILFDIADRAAAFAGGVDPRTGQSMAGRSPAAQLGAAVSGLGGQIGQRVAGMEQQDQQLRLAALQAAQGEYSAEQAAARAAAARAGERGIGNAFEAVDENGNVVAMEYLSTRSDLDAFREANPGTTVRPAQGAAITDADYFSEYGMTRAQFEALPESDRRRLQGLERDADTVLREVGGDLYNLTDPNNPVLVLSGANERDLREIGGSLVDVTDPNNVTVVYTAPGQAELRTVGGVLLEVTDPNNPQIVYQAPGSADREIVTVNGRVVDVTDPDNTVVLYESPETADLGSFINIQTRDGEVVSVRENSQEAADLIAQDGTIVARTGPVREDLLTDPEALAAYAAGEAGPAETARIQAAIAENTSGVFNRETGRFEQPIITPLVRQAEEARRAAGLSTVLAFPEDVELPQEGAERERVLAELGGEAFGTTAFFDQLANTAFALVDADAPRPRAQAAVAAVNALNQDALIAFRTITGGRTAQEAINQFQENLPTPAQISGSPDSAADQIEQVINLFNSSIESNRRALLTSVASPADRQRLQEGIISGQAMVRAYEALLRGVRGGPTGAPVDPAQFRR